MSHTTQCTNPFKLEKQNKIPARYWLIRSYINRWYKMAEDGRRWQRGDTHFEDEGQFPWDFQSRKYCWHPHSAGLAFCGVGLQGRRQTGNPGWHPTNRVFCSGKADLTMRVTLFIHNSSYPNSLEFTRTVVVTRHFSPTKEGTGKQERLLHVSTYPS